MCGIAGFVGQETRDHLEKMVRTLVHRGPDDQGLFLAPGIGLGMRRLSIIDLAGGRQPMANEDGSLWIVFNGEIYNHRSLRPDLETKGHRFKTRSDTEVILHLYEDEGERCVDRLRGMFAFAVWDANRRRFGSAPAFRIAMLADRSRMTSRMKDRAIILVSIVVQASAYSLDRFPLFHRGLPSLLASGKLLSLGTLTWALLRRLRVQQGIG
jgi:hypothetical protein